MGRPLRIEYPGALYHITSRGNERKDIFLDDEDRYEFLSVLGDYHDRYGILIHSYVLMSNHYHLIIETPEGNLLKVMHGINGRYTGYFNRRYARSGHLFQGRYKGILVDKENYLVQLSRYVHLNPVRARIVPRPEAYRWSSYAGFIGKGKEVRWMEYSWILNTFSRDAHKARTQYRAFVEEGLRGEIETPLKDLHGQVVLGGKEFIEKIKKMLKGKHLSKEIVERKRFKRLELPDTILKRVAVAFGTEAELIRHKGRRDSDARKAAIYLVQRYSGLSNEEIGRIFGGIHFSAVSKSTARLKDKIADDKRLAGIMEELESNVKA
ncbi:MAG: transposase [Nitrospirae bacterium]|nr:transposase [Nitrospirota bacterium]MDA8215411.1 transposase [Nitrospiraceae bacterium]